MCMMLYIASDKKLPLVEMGDNYNHFICVCELDESATGVIKQFTKKYVYYVGSYQRCGCGFQFDDNQLLELEGLTDEIVNYVLEDKDKRRNSVKELFEYISENIKSVGEMELYSCWAGNEEGKPEHKKDIYLSTFSLGGSFRFEENQLIKVKE